ncbi:beta-glucosidase-like glycosyl hydrolase [Neobacillus ginsengisoli]|uniref:Beta-glucosidase-like glycosyl hydrolase n=1 Tax=Neobacillus ginsengisoli TaxID=904295 RepID=A0ABT9XSZ5_9BACI|nr:beta-glucosidase-like glycosyl hydrolase [Neobacillus ginsengisoli]
MTAHVIINAIDPKLPAILSKKVLTGLQCLYKLGD